MAKILFVQHHGSLVGIWPGRSVRKEGLGPRKEGQLYLGKVIDQDKRIFWTRKRGYYTFNPEDQTFGEVVQQDVPPVFVEPNNRKRKAPIIVDFGDSNFLNSLIYGIGYNEVLDAITYQNRDSLYAAVSYYVLESAANCHAETWIRQNYASFLYPKANIGSQRFSEMLSSIGSHENICSYLASHINFLTQIYGDDLCVLIDSTGIENHCNIPVTCFSKHNGDVNLEFRLIVIVQKSTGIPIFYEYIPGNIIDVTTIKRLLLLLDEYGCNVEYCITDAGYLCPKNIERLVLSGIDFMSRLNPNFIIYKNAINLHIDELDKDDNVVRFKNRLIHIIKVPSVIASEKHTGNDIEGFIYLCKDIQSAQSVAHRLSIPADHIFKAKHPVFLMPTAKARQQNRFYRNIPILGIGPYWVSFRYSPGNCQCCCQPTRANTLT